VLAGGVAVDAVLYHEQNMNNPLRPHSDDLRRACGQTLRKDGIRHRFGTGAPTYTPLQELAAHAEGCVLAGGCSCGCCVVCCVMDAVLCWDTLSNARAHLCGCNPTDRHAKEPTEKNAM
jgi:hypothetical protein